MTDILNNIRRIAVNAVNAQKLADVAHGRVIQTGPLKIQIDQKLILNEEHLILTKAVTDYVTEMSIDGGPKQTYTVYNGLRPGDLVTMIRSHGGQQYIIIDKE
ncbi:DUF2577 domain-containing protein [Paucisalibacillus globulus]|uniref:DUF2577 domain-containing protein n=1 Tax=Paucisalibacillus globulus TaxID=351095 RepID=UPI000BB72BF1|nr:DUF2577 domain-containing protein [Paucisalibacillus globulus]